MARSAAPAVALVSARTISSNNPEHTIRTGVLEGRVEVANYSHTKTVGIVYSVDGGEWQAANASYKQTLPGGREIWEFSVTIFEVPFGSDSDARNIQFALFMEANGTDYWDNNSGNDYSISTVGENMQYSTFALGSRAVELAYASHAWNYRRSYGAILNVKAVLKNIAYAKDVQLVYTVDNWEP